MSTTKKTITLRLLAVILICITCLANFNITANAAVTCDIPVSRNVNGWVVPAGSSKQSSTELYLYPGDIVYFNFTYTPSSASMSFGLSTPSNKFRLFNTAAGSGVARYTMTINEEGVHKFKVRNNSSGQNVTVNGRYSTGCSYPFRSSYMATKISQSYSSSHYGMDIVASNPGDIKGYPIYSVGSGTVKVSTYSSSAGYYAVVVGKGGYTTRYLHMNSQPSVSVENAINESTLIGYVGNSGTSSGYHLHIDVNTVNGYYGGSASNNVNSSTTIDPKTLFPQISFTY